MDKGSIEEIVERDFRPLCDQIKSIEKIYNPNNENLHFSQLLKADDALFDKLYILAQEGLSKVKLHHKFFIRGRLYSDCMFWYSLCVLIGSAAVTAKSKKISVKKDVIIGIVKILVNISRYATATGGDMWKRNHEALAETLFAFYDDDLVETIIKQSELVGLIRVKDFVRYTLAAVEKARAREAKEK